MPIKRGKYQLPNSELEQRTEAEKYGIKIAGFPTGYDDTEFHSYEVTIAGKKYSGGYGTESRWAAVGKMRESTEAIKGLHCPDCNAQAFKTDHKNVAVCGDYPGWYFFYRKVAQELEPKKTMKLINGEYVIVDEAEKTEGDL